jgi:hypothetical protein
MQKKEAHRLVVENLGLIYTIGNKHGGISSSFDKDDVIQAMTHEALVQFERRFDPDRGTPSNFIGCVMWRFLRKLRDRHSQPDEIHTGEHDVEAEVANPEYFRALFEDFVSQLRGFSTELATVLQVLFDCDGDKGRAATELGVGKTYLYDRIAEIRDCPVGADIAAAL